MKGAIFVRHFPSLFIADNQDHLTHKEAARKEEGDEREMRGRKGKEGKEGKGENQTILTLLLLLHFLHFFSFLLPSLLLPLLSRDVGIIQGVQMRANMSRLIKLWLYHYMPAMCHLSFLGLQVY